MATNQYVLAVKILLSLRSGGLPEPTGVSPLVYIGTQNPRGFFI